MKSISAEGRGGRQSVISQGGARDGLLLKLHLLLFILRNMHSFARKGELLRVVTFISDKKRSRTISVF